MHATLSSSFIFSMEDQMLIEITTLQLREAQIVTYCCQFSRT